jgi:restriction endonuclease BglII
VRIDEFSFKSGKEILASRPALYASILAALVNAQEARLRKPKTSKAKYLHREFPAEGWGKGPSSEPRFSFLKERIAIQILFSDRDLTRFLSAFVSDQIDVGVLIVDSKNELNRIKADLAWLRGTITVPLWVIALK